MKLFVIGMGQCGGRIVDLFLEYDARSDYKIVESHLAIDSDPIALGELGNVSNWLDVSDGGVDCGAMRDCGRRYTENYLDRIMDRVGNIGVAGINAFLIVLGFGGGTGSGGTPVLAREIRENYIDKKVYCLGILPEDDLPPGITNARECFSELYKTVDNTLLYDNKFWRDIDKVGFRNRNAEMVKRFRSLFIAGEISGPDVTIGTGEVVATLGVDGGISTIGYASESAGIISGCLSRKKLRKGEDPNTKRIFDLVQKATTGRLTMPCDYRNSGAEKAMIAIAAPANRLSGDGILRSRSWLATDIIGRDKDVRGGQYPIRSKEVSVTVLLSGATNIQRFKDVIEEKGKGKSKEKEKRKEKAEEE